MLGQVVEKEFDLQQLGVPLHRQRVGGLISAQHGSLLDAGQLLVMEVQQLEPVQAQQDKKGTQPSSRRSQLLDW